MTRKRSTLATLAAMTVLLALALPAVASACTARKLSLRR
jgi:hypothetical protein